MNSVHNTKVNICRLSLLDLVTPRDSRCSRIFRTFRRRISLTSISWSVLGVQSIRKNGAAFYGDFDTVAAFYRLTPP